MSAPPERPAVRRLDPPNLRRLLALGALCTALLATCLAAAAPALARYDPIGGGSTRLTLARPFLSLLKANGVSVKATAGATYKAGTATFPVSGGKLEPVSVVGSVEHEGVLVFGAGGHSLPLKTLVLKTTRKSSPLSAKFGGGQLKLAASSKLASVRSGFGVASRVTQIRLSAKAAGRLDKKLGLGGVFAEGQLLGSSTTEVQPESVTIEEGGRAELTLDPGFAAKLASLFVAVNPIFPAEHPGAFSFPIIGGALAPGGGGGTLATGGAIELLQLGGGQVILHDPVAELGPGAVLSAEAEFLPSPPFAGKVGAAPELSISGGTASSEPTARSITLSGATLALSPTLAARLDEAFAVPQGRSGVFLSGEVFAAFSFAARGE